MENKNDDPLEFDEGFETEFEDELSDDFYDDTLDDNFEADSYDPDMDSDFEQDFEEEFGSPEIDESLIQKEKKSGFNLSFNALVIIGALVIGSIVLVFQVMKQPSTQMADRFTSALNLEGADDGIFSNTEDTKSTSVEVNHVITQGNVNGDQSSLASEETPFLYEPEILDSMEVELGNVPPQPAPISEIIESVEVDQPNIEDMIDEADIFSPLDGTQEIPRSPEGLVEASPAEIVEQGQQNQLDISTDVKSEEQDSVVDPAVMATDALVQDPPAKSANVQPVESTKPSGNIDLSGVENKLDQIVDRLDDMDVQINQLQGSVDSKITGINNEIKAIETRITTIAKQRVINKAPTPQQPSVKSQKAQESVAPQPKKIPEWELRAAQPGKAWLSQKGSSDIRSVQVGDTIQGLGRIENILYQNGRWSVIGSLNTINQ